jgi:hypothetical protein
MPFLSIRAGTKISLNKPCAELFPPAPRVVFLIDKETQMVAIRAERDGEEGYALVRQKSQMTISARSLIAYLKLTNGRIPCVISDGMIQFSSAPPEDLC